MDQIGTETHPKDDTAKQRNIRIDDERWEKLDEVALMLERDRSWVIRKLIDHLGSYTRNGADPVALEDLGLR